MRTPEYTEVTVVIDGALDQSETFVPDSAARDRFVREQMEWATAHPGSHVQVFVLWHPHREEDECECMQYVQDHRPDYEWNVPTLMDACGTCEHDYLLHLHGPTDVAHSAPTEGACTHAGCECTGYYTVTNVVFDPLATERRSREARVYRDTTDEASPCLAGTPGCGIDHTTDTGDCASW
jgi:hypothetical protein